MGRWNGKTSERGYGADHATIRRQRVAAYRPGDICTMGGEPLWQPPELLDVPHDHVNGGYLPGLSCRPHNRGEGASRGNQIRGFTLAAAGPKGPHVTCGVCGRPYSRAARACEMCGAHYHPTYGQQRTCSRVCGVQLRRRNNGTAGRTPKPRSACKVCGKPRNGLRQAYCSRACAGQARTDMRSAWPAVAIAYYTCRYCGKVGITMANMRQRREVCPADPCQLARLTANNLIARKGMTREQADAAVLAYRAEGDHRRMITPEKMAADRKWAQTVAAVKQATMRAW